MALKIEIAETERFEFDCALYGFDGDPKKRALEYLRSDPVAGMQRADQPRVWEWKNGSFVISYALSDDFSRLLLVELRPWQAPRTDISGKAWTWIDRINKLKRLLGL